LVLPPCAWCQSIWLPLLNTLVMAQVALACLLSIVQSTIAWQD